jgi:hypothetical protein
MTRWLLAIASLLLAPQAERITVRMAPAPNQVVRMRASQEVTLTGEPEGPPGSTPAIPSMAIATISNLDYTMTVGIPNEQGRYDARIVCDSAEATMTRTGGSCRFLFADDRRAFPIVYDADSKSVEITGGSESGRRRPPAN